MRERNESSKSEIKDKTRERKVLKSIILSEMYDEQQEITKRREVNEWRHRQRRKRFVLVLFSIVHERKQEKKK